MASSLLATVAIAAPLDKALSYAVPEALRGQARVGVRLRVPLGRRRVIGYLLGVAEGDASGLREVEAVLDLEPLFPPEMISFFHRAADYYRFPLGEVIRTALPAGLSGETGRVGIATERLFTPTRREGEPAGPRQREILEWLRNQGPSSSASLARVFPAPQGALRRLVELGFVAAAEVERRRDPFLDRPPGEDRVIQPTPEQASAITAVEAAIERGGFAPFLLHGITGSGKTEVYLRSIAAALVRNRRALVLVPEIALTPQLVGRFRARFAGAARIAVLHSALSEGERYDAWRAIARGEAEIVIGARSAVFAPLPDLGMVVIDEEHETSYKQADGFRYHARDLALLRAQMAQAVILLGSATPALPTYHRARELRQMEYLSLAGRPTGGILPAVEIVDLAADRPTGTLSAALAAALRDNLEGERQSLLLLNRRGFAPFLLCADCGLTFRCPNCDITLTFYQGMRRLRCNYCDYVEEPPAQCPRCHGARFQPEGAGTERLEEELAALFPAARIARMDRDSTARRGAHQQLIDRMERGEIDILVGTQMVAKGHDFPGVTLVGVVNADAALNFPDFRSAERTFSLLTQVAGRAGRGTSPGRVIIQTWSADHYAITAASRHDFEAFYAEEAAHRRDLGYPPFGHLVNLVFSGLAGERVARFAAQIASALEPCRGEVEILGPAPCPLARLRGKNRFQVLLKARSRPPLRHLLQKLDPLRRSLPAGVALAVDVDPVDML